MERNIKIVLQYDGTRYDGWQKQKNTEWTIQGKLEAVLEKMAGKSIEVHGSGRTDGGVHALGQVANFHLPEECLQTPASIKTYLNQYLPEDIMVLDAEEAPARFHSRLNAQLKVYEYRIETAEKKNVFERKYCYGLEKELDINAMRRAAEILEGTHDFKSFCSLKKTKKSTVRTLAAVKVKKEGTKVILSYEGNGFLYHMARILTGTLIEVGLHKRTVESVRAALNSYDRSQAGKTAPAEGLFLVKVSYEEKNFQSMQ